MGVDAQMLVKVKGDVPQDSLLQIAYKMSCCFPEELWGREPFDYSGDSDDEGYIGQVTKDSGCLRRVNVFHQDGDSLCPEDGETFIEVSLWGRYYGEGYERGDIVAYCAIAEFLEHHFPGCTIYYGGDSSGICAEPFDADSRKRHLAHYFEVARNPYIGGFAGHHHAPFTPKTRFYKEPMVQTGGGPGCAFFFDQTTSKYCVWRDGKWFICDDAFDKDGREPGWDIETGDELSKKVSA